MSIYKGTQLISGVATPVEAGRNIGQIIQSLLPITDAGLHLLDGTLIDGNGIYKAFVDYIKTLDLTASYFTTEADWQASVTQYGVCGKFVYNASANTVRLPKVTGILEGTIDANALGDLVEQFVRLPNITGSFAYSCNEDATPAVSGAYTRTAISADTNNGAGYQGDGNSNNYTFAFNASLSSNVYSGNGSDTKIQPQSIKGYYYIVVATSAKTDVEVDIDNVVTDLNNKVDVSNMVDAGSYIAGCAMPSSTYTDLTIGASAALYTAPANGFFYVATGITTATALSEVSIFNRKKQDSAIYGCRSVCPANGNKNPNCFLPVEKGDVVTINYQNVSINAFRFIYAQGSESEAQ